MNPEDLQLASYRGAAWFVSAAGTSGGRKDAKKVIIDSDRQVIEDLGKRQRVFTLSGVVAARRTNDGQEILSYQASRDRLLSALEKGGTGVLIHPFFGRLDNVVARTFTLNEDIKRLGEAEITITFEISNTSGAPQPAEDVLGSIVSGNEAVQDAVNADISENLSVTAAFTGNFQDAIDKGNEIVDEINEATQPVAIAADQLDEFSAELSDFTANITSLVANPSDFADSVIGLYQSMNGLYAGTAATFESTFAAMTRLFPFGEDDVDFPLDTAGRVERQRNRTTVNNAMKSLGLSFAYENASQFSFATSNEVDDVSTVLEDQFQALVQSGDLSSDVEEALTKLRVRVADFFIAAKLQKPQIVLVETPFTSTRLLAYQYYGESTLGETIAELNELDDLNAIQGQIRILSA